jgi:hypothetical protein
MGLTAITPSGFGSSIASDLLGLERTCLPKLKAIPSRLYRSFGPALVGAVAFALATTALADPVWNKVGEAFGKAGTEMPGGVYRIALPRTDIKATLDGSS